MSHYTENGGQPSARNEEACLLDSLGLASGTCEARASCSALGLSPEEQVPAKTVRVRCLGKLMVRRCRPRRLDKRVVARRPMMLVKRRLVARMPHALFSGREIIART